MVHSRDVVLILMLATATGACAQPDDAAQNGSAPGAAEQATPQDAPVVVSDTPEDSLIFERTVAWVRESRSDTLPIGELIAAIGQRFVGAPYTPGLLEVPETEQLVVNLREFDCVTYVEHMLSMARAIAAGEPTYGRFKDELRRIRYRDGELTGYPSRLHYFSEWISNNDDKGVVENITQALGGVRDTTGIDFMSRHTESYRQLADSVNLQAIREKEAELSSFPRYMIPENRIADVADQIRNGDVIAATSTVPGLDIAHTGLALWVDGRLHLMHAPLVGSMVEISEVPLAERIQRIEAQDGIMVARPQPPQGAAR
ncbi:MAG: DUF1460 domain-containing protein [Candidatus Cloacimonetes bacterium]|jgi:hypothetical protein|nr:DUF1460 domain-containing protein [Candidatus Cloacimonadota bacterium]